MKTHRLQEAFARKREAERIRTERTSAVDNYFVHWGKVTSKFENWTTPEYYEQAEKNLQKKREQLEKEERLKVRREKLRHLLIKEKLSFEQELAILRKPKSRNMNTNVMEKIDQNFKARQDERRRLELEAKLYGRWRHGIDDESLLYESKSDNQVLAKLNWLDKQIEDQVKREEEEKMAQERALRLQEEIRITEQHQKERQEIREKEIQEIRALQEKHMQELREREQEADILRSEAEYLHNSVDHLKTELSILNKTRPVDYHEGHLSNNLRKIKMTIRKRSDEFREQLKSDIDLLGRINAICADDTVTSDLMEKFQKQRDEEILNLAQIENMYESEAKANLKQCQEAWHRLNFERHLDLTNLLKDLEGNLSSKFHENQLRQKDLIDIRTTHLSSIENSNERLKLLIKEQEDSPRPMVVETPRNVPEQPRKPIIQNQPSKSLHKVSDSFTNLNLDCLGGGDSDSRPQSARSELVFAQDSARPKFGRKRVAWV